LQDVRFVIARHFRAKLFNQFSKSHELVAREISSSFETGMCVEMLWTRTLRNAVTFLNTATLSFSGTPIGPMPVSQFEIDSRLFRFDRNASASSTAEIVGMNLPSTIADRSLAKPGQES